MMGILNKIVDKNKKVKLARAVLWQTVYKKVEILAPGRNRLSRR